MLENKYINSIIVVLMIVAVLLTSIIMVRSPIAAESTEEPEYITRLFAQEGVTEINIDMDQDDWEWIIENATEEEYRSADITVDGETFYNVGIRPKGNSSLQMVASNDDSDRFSFKLDFDQYIDGQTCFGLEKIVLNNMISDATYMKEYLSYEFFDMMGVVTPAYSYANITVNGEPWGLYLMVESPEESYLERNFGSSYGNLYKPEGNGSDLVWTGEDEANYSGIKDNAVVEVTDSDFDRVVEMIRNLNSGTDLEEYLDVDATLRYFAVNTILVNMDSYAGIFKHNYYLYEENGVFTILPWDLNESFAGFQINSGQEAVNFSIDTPVAGNLEDYPLIGKLLEVPEYEELYRQYLAEAVQLYFDSGFFSTSIDKLDQLISSYVENDSTAFYTYEQYRQSLSALKEFGSLRAASVTAQLTGNTEPISADFDFSLLGSMGGGRGMDGAARKPNLPTDEGQNFPAGEQMPPGMNVPEGEAIPPEEGGVPREEGFGGMGPQRTAPGERTNMPPGNMGDLPGAQGNKPIPGDLPTGLNPELSKNMGLIAGSGTLLLTAGLVFAVKFPRRKHVIPK